MDLTPLQIESGVQAKPLKRDVDLADVLRVVAGTSRRLAMRSERTGSVRTLAGRRQVINDLRRSVLEDIPIAPLSRKLEQVWVPEVGQPARAARSGYSQSRDLHSQSS